MIWGIGAALLMGVVSYRLKLLSLSGAMAAVVLGMPIFAYGGWMWATPLLTFFLLSNGVGKVGKAKKLQFDLVFEKGGQRDAYQVLANGGIAGLVAVTFAVTGRVDLFVVYCAALAAAAADTWATELGTLARAAPRLITTFEQVPAGTSGGVTLVGMLGASAGALSVALCGWFFYGGLDFVILVMVCGIMGSVLDSIMGATLQAQYVCGVCGKVTEKPNHCDQTTEAIMGWRWMNNDWVNGLSVAGASMLAFVFMFLM